MTRFRSPSRIPWLLWSVLLLVFGLILGAEMLWLKGAHKHQTKDLPVLGKVPDFEFTSEAGLPVTRKSLEGKIWVADFIFTRCAGPCPEMSEHMRELQGDVRLYDRVRLVSMTVDPAYDTPEVLQKYGFRFGSNPDQWSFLTGDPAAIDRFITKGMLLGLSKDEAGLPIHSQKFVVVDGWGNIRAYHDLDEPGLVPSILTDLDVLNRETQMPTPTPTP